MIEMWKAIKVLGVGRVLALARAQRRFWRGTIHGYYATNVINELFRVGLLDAMRHTPAVQPRRFADEHGLDPEHIQVLCDYLYSIRIFERDGPGYCLNADGELLVDIAKGWFEAVAGYSEVYHRLPDLVQKKAVYGDSVHRDAHLIAKGSGRMEALAFFPLVIDMIREAGYTRVLDIGSGDGRFLIDLCLANPGVIGYGIDIAPNSIKLAAETVQGFGLDNRIHLHLLDLGGTKEPPEELRGVQVATTFFVLHEVLFHGQDAVVRFLVNFRRLFPGVPLVVFEVLRASLEDTRRSRGMSAEYYLQHDLTHQRLVGRAEWLEVFSAAGFQQVEERNLAYSKTAIFTLR